jgi:sulfur carrier protein ThiS adenylyltransferase
MIWDSIVDRQKGILNFTDELLQAIRRTRIAAFGTGGNGAVVDFLLRVGYQHFELIDFDVVEPSNLNRLPFTAADVGKPKVQAWRDYLLSVNPDCRVAPHQKMLTRNDEAWVAEIVDRADIVTLGVTGVEANLLVSRVCHRLKKRMIVGPGTAGCWVVSTLTHQNGVSIESVGRFGTEDTDLRDIDYDAVLPRFEALHALPGRAERFDAEVRSKVRAGNLAPRSCKIFVAMVNAAACWEVVKNTAVLNGMELQNTAITEFPILQVFDPFRGSSHYYDAAGRRVGIPDWLTGEIRWTPLPHA